MNRWLKTAAFFLVLLIGGGVFAVYISSAYMGALRRKKEVMLQQNLWTMRKAVDFYANDKGKKPQSFDDLISAGYLREIPADPFTGSNIKPFHRRGAENAEVSQRGREAPSYTLSSSFSSSPLFSARPPRSLRLRGEGTSLSPLDG